MLEFKPVSIVRTAAAALAAALTFSLMLTACRNAGGESVTPSPEITDSAPAFSPTAEQNEPSEEPTAPTASEPEPSETANTAETTPSDETGTGEPVYDVDTEEYHSDTDGVNADIEYYTIEGTADDEKVNSLLRDPAFSILLPSDNGVEAEVTPFMSYSGQDMLSVYYDYYVYYSGAAHPGYGRIGVTIDLEKPGAVGVSKIMPLETIKQRFESGEFEQAYGVYDSNDGPPVSDTWFEAYHIDPDDQHLDDFYIDETHLYLIIEAPYAAGSFIVMKMPFESP